MKKNTMAVKKSKTLDCNETYFQRVLGKTVLKGVVFNEMRVYWEAEPLSKYLGLPPWTLPDLFRHRAIVKTKQGIMPMEVLPDDFTIPMFIDHVALKQHLENIVPKPETIDLDNKIKNLVALFNSMPESLERIKAAFNAKW